MAKAYSAGLSRFLRGLFMVENTAGPCIRLSLRHMTDGKTTPDVNNYNISDAQEIDDAFLNTIQEQIEFDADNDASAVGGVQRYQVVAYRSSMPDRAWGRYALRDGDASEEETAFDSEPKNEKGLVSQLMRHNEALMRSQVTSTNNVLSIMARQLQQASADRETLMKDRMDNIGVIEQLLSGDAARKLMEEKQNHELDMKRQIQQGLLMLAPAAINRITGTNLLPESVNPAMMMVKNFVESIKPEQFEYIMSTLDPAQKVAMITMMQKLATPEGEGQGR